MVCKSPRRLELVEWPSVLPSKCCQVLDSIYETPLHGKWFLTIGFRFCCMMQFWWNFLFLFFFPTIDFSGNLIGLPLIRKSKLMNTTGPIHTTKLTICKMRDVHMLSTASLAPTLTSRDVQEVLEAHSRAAATIPIKRRLAEMLSLSRLQPRIKAQLC